MVAKPTSLHSRRVRENRSLPFGRVLFDDRAFDPALGLRLEPNLPLRETHPRRDKYCLLLIPISKIHPGSKARFTTAVVAAPPTASRAGRARLLLSPPPDRWDFPRFPGAK